jgi:hypothetical protein
MRVPMNWNQIVRHTATAIGVAFVVVAVLYLVFRIFMFEL